MDTSIIKAAQVGGIFGAAVLSGYIACFSYAGVATLTEAPLGVLVKQFDRMYNIGKLSSPPLALSATVCNGFAAYTFWNDNFRIEHVIPRSALYLAAMVSVMSIVPFTLLCMEPLVNRKLLGLGEEARRGVMAKDLGVTEEQVRQMLVTWKRLNSVRAALASVGALLSAVATLA